MGDVETLRRENEIYYFNIKEERNYRNTSDNIHEESLDDLEARLRSVTGLN